jgi:uncharacterized protein
MSYLPGKFIWFEHVSGDPAKARAFYEPLFGWHVENMAMGDQTYAMIHNGQQGIGGLTPAEAGEAPQWRSFISVLDVDRAYREALAAGATGTMEPTDFGPVGRGAGIVDPTGAPVSLWHSNDADRADAQQVPFGDWYWTELWTPDAKKALAFYEKVIGYTHETKNMGDGGDYHLLMTGEIPRGGVFQSNEEGTPPMWMPYVHVADCDATAAKATQLGAKVFMPPMDVQGVGRFAAAFDPLGAAFAFILGKPEAM